MVGMMGAGKTTVGKALAARHGLAFVDADEALEARTGVPIPLIFEMEGEAGFRDREARLLDELLARENLVIATGGGAVTRAENRQRFKRRGVVVYLEAPLEVLWERLQHDRTRPLLQVPDPKARLAALLTERDPWYREVADLIVTTRHGRLSAVVQALEEALIAYGVPLPAPSA
nr:shikimate kinase [Hydrogenophilus thiooxidans]